MDNEALEEYISYETPIGQTLLQVTKLAKKPQLNEDLSKTLDIFLDQLHQADEYLANGISFQNFAVSGLVLQKATQIFSKKVDMLWEELMQYQKRQLKYMEEDQKLSQAKKLDEIQNRIHKTKTLIKLAKYVPESFNLGAAIKPVVDEELEESWKGPYETESKAYQMETSRFEFKNLKSRVDDIGVPHPNHVLCDAEIYNEDEDETFRYKNIFGCYNLLKHLTDHEMYNSSDIYYQLVKEIDYFDDYRIENGISAKVPREEYEEEFEKYARHRFQDVIFVEETPEIKESFVVLEKLPDDVVSEKLRRMSSTKGNENVENLTDSGYFEENSDEWSEENPENVEDSIVDSTSNLIIPPEFKERSLSVVLTKENLRLTRKRKFSYKEEIVELETELEEKTIPKKKQRKFNVKKLCTGITANLNSWEKFFSENYSSEIGEGDVLPYIEPEPVQQEDDPIEEDNPVQENDSIEDDDLIENISEENNVEEEPSTSDEMQEKGPASYEELCKIHQDRENVREWIKKGKELMKNANDHDFDIHAYELDIINQLSRNESRFFKDIVRNKSRADFVRYTVSSLHLAVTENIEFSGVVPGSCSNNSLKMKLLNTYRHHLDIDKFNAPSKQLMRDRFKRLHESHSNNTPSCRKSNDENIPSEANFIHDFDPGPSMSGLQRQSTPIRSPQPKKLCLVVKNISYS